MFKNPGSGPGAGALIEACGLKGFRSGGALISERHANFIENAGGATSADAVALMAEARRRVHERFGVVLEHEVRFLGTDRAAAAVGKRPSAANSARGEAEARPCADGASGAETGRRRRSGRRRRPRRVS